jgi:hypothetical protein
VTNTPQSVPEQRDGSVVVDGQSAVTAKRSVAARAGAGVRVPPMVEPCEVVPLTTRMLDDAAVKWRDCLKSEKSTFVSAAWSGLAEKGDARLLRNTLQRKLEHKEFLIVPVWLPVGNGHWAVLVCKKIGPNITAIGFDSVPLGSSHTFLRRLCLKLDVVLQAYGSFGTQAPGTCSCGLFCLRVLRFVMKYNEFPAFDTTVVDLELERFALLNPQAPSTASQHTVVDDMPGRKNVKPVRVSKNTLCTSCSTWYPSSEECRICGGLPPSAETKVVDLAAGRHLSLNPAQNDHQVPHSTPRLEKNSRGTSMEATTPKTGRVPGEKPHFCNEAVVDEQSKSTAVPSTARDRKVVRPVRASTKTLCTSCSTWYPSSEGCRICGRNEPFAADRTAVETAIGPNDTSMSNPSVSVGPTDVGTPVSVSETQEERLKIVATCCKGQKTASGHCPWHHHLVSDVSPGTERENCSGKNHKGHECQERSLAIVVPGVSVCWYHASAAQRRLIDDAFTAHQILLRTRGPDRLRVEEMQPLGCAVGITMRANGARAWKIFSTRPPHVHLLTWSRITPATRKQHILWLQRISSMPSDLLQVPLASAVVELVLRLSRQRSWAWGTTASGLSNCAQALLNLPIYSSELHGIDIKEEPVFCCALRRALALSRLDYAEERSTPHFSKQKWRELLQELRTPAARLLAEVAFSTACRVGDLRLTKCSDFTLSDAQGDAPIVLTVRLRAGKAGAFWGPSAHKGVISSSVAKSLTAFIKGRSKTDAPLWNMADQQALSNMLKQHGYGLRSIRKSAIILAAAAGVPLDELQIFSGHTCRRTLLRYLNWGAAVGDKSAIALAQAVGSGPPDAASPPRASTRAGVRTATESTDRPTATVRPPKMGIFSGFFGPSGRRTDPPPKLFPTTAPSSRQLGLTDDESTWPLHAPGVSPLHFKVIQRWAGELLPQIKEASRRLNDPSAYAIEEKPKRMPPAKFSRADIDKMLTAQKIRRTEASAHVTVRAFTVPQAAKNRRRPIFEPWANSLELLVPPLLKCHYASRLERRQACSKYTYAADFDMHAYFDQFGLSRDTSHQLVFENVIRDPLGSPKLERFELLRLPMGARCAPSVAQFTTWILLYPLIKNQKLKILTCIDNVRILANDSQSFVDAVKTFLQRCKVANVSLNAHEFTGDERQWPAKGQEISKDSEFLGERFCNGSVCNTPKVLAKLERSWAAIKIKCTRRTLVSFISLLIYCTHTLNIPLRNLFKILRMYVSVASQTQPWDSPAFLTPTMITTLQHLVEILLANVPRPVLCFPLPPVGQDRIYDATIFVDACSAGFGAWIKFRGRFNTTSDAATSDPHTHVAICAGWSAPMRSSAHAEPLGAGRALAYLLHALGVDDQHPLEQSYSIAVVVDHLALATGQRRSWSNYGGFSTNNFLNTFYVAFYGPENGIRRDVYYVPGPENPVDGLSRSVKIGDKLSVKTLNCVFPSLDGLHHPYSTPPARQWYEV